MTLAEIQRFRPTSLGDTDRAKGLPQPRGSEDPEGAGFGTALKNAVEQVDGAQKEAGSQITAFVAGEQENLHEVMISMNQAQLSFQLMTEVRNKMLETYQELMRMQV